MNKLNSDLQQEILLSNVFLFHRIFPEREILFRQGRNTKDEPHIKPTHTSLKKLSSVTRATRAHTINPIM